MFLRSIRFKIILWYTLLLTVTLLAFSSILYGGFTKMLYGAFDDLLVSRAEGVANSLYAYWAAKEVAIAQGDDSSGGFLKVAGGWVEEKRKDPELMSIFVTILDDKGRAVISTKSSPRLEPMSQHALGHLLEGEDDFDTVKGEAAQGKNIRFRVYSKPIVENGKLEYIVQVAAPVRLLAIAANNLMLALFLLLPLTVLLAAAPGLILVRMTLKPVDDMIATLRQTTAENLKLRIHMPDTKDEIKRLADTFNDMIERLDRSFSSQQGFIQDISSELRAPIAKLEKEFDDALKGALTVEEARRIIGRGPEELKRFERIIEGLETLSQYDNNRVPLEIRRVKLAALIEMALKDAEAKAADKGISISSVLKDRIVIDADARQLRTLFANILDNAIKFTNRKGSVSVSMRKLKRSAEVSVSDTGIGIEEGELPYIFDRFYQVNKSRGADGSFGLGLSIAKSVAQMHKGSIAVESKSGGGSTFTVTLPLSYPG
jgi:signal transduction histidine kinase